MKTTLELLEEGGMNFLVEKRPSFIESKHTVGRVATNFFGLVNNVNENTFAMVSDQYEVFQNAQLAEVSLKLAEKINAKAITASSHKGGKNVAVDVTEKETLLEYPERGDVIKTGIKITNVHGGGSIKVMNQSLVLSCTNGMTRAVTDRSTSIPHSKNLLKMLDDLLFANEVAMEHQKTWLEEIERMIDKPITSSHIQNMVMEVLEVDVAKITVDGKSDDYSSRKVNQAVSLMDSIKEEMAYKGNNVWGLLNGITHYTSHKAGKNEDRDTSKVFGSLFQKDKKAQEVAYSFIN